MNRTPSTSSWFVRVSFGLVVLAACSLTPPPLLDEDAAPRDSGTEEIDGAQRPDAENAWVMHRIVASDAAASSDFGIVAISGDILAVGAPADDETAMDSGAVYIFEWNDVAMMWEEKTKLKASDAAAGRLFGRSLDLDGTTLAVGSPSNTGYGAGVYIFERSFDGTWTQRPKLTSGLNHDSFGRAVSLQVPWLVIGAPGDDAVQVQAGAVYVYVYGTSWALDEKLTNPDGDQDDRLGEVVKISANRIAVTAAGDDVTPGYGEGLVYVFEGSGPIWQMKPPIGYSESSGGLGFGDALDLSGDTLVVGVPRADRLGMTGSDDAGAVAIHTRNSATGVWDHVQTLTASDAAADAFFGAGVAIVDDAVYVGASGTSGDTGTVYRFDKAVSWAEMAIIAPNGIDAGDKFGAPIDVDGSRVVFGSQGDASRAGAAYVYMP